MVDLTDNYFPRYLLEMWREFQRR